MATPLWAMALVIFGSLISSFSPILLKKASKKKLLNLRSLITNYELFGAIALFGLGVIIYIIALKASDLSILFPLTSLSYVWVSLYSVKFLGEKMSKFKWVGIFLIIVGVTFIGVGSG